MLVRPSWPALSDSVIKSYGRDFWYAQPPNMWLRLAGRRWRLDDDLDREGADDGCGGGREMRLSKLTIMPKFKSDVAKRRLWTTKVTAIGLAFFLSTPPVAAA